MATSAAQKVAFIKTDSILSVVNEYKTAQVAISTKADALRAELEADLKTIDELFNLYQSQKQYLTASAKASREEQIIKLENALKEKQDKYFGENGEMSRTSASLLTPIKDRVNAVIKEYALENGYSMVVDVTAAGNIVYYDEGSDITGKIIEKLK